MNNLYDNPAYNKVKKSLHKELDRLARKYKDPVAMQRQ
jgi:hypothetical protein